MDFEEQEAHKASGEVGKLRHPWHQLLGVEYGLGRCNAELVDIRVKLASLVLSRVTAVDALRRAGRKCA